MSFTGKISHLNTWNYCSTCFRQRTESPNGCKCQACRRKPRRRLASHEHKKAREERARILKLLRNWGMHAAVAVVEAASPKLVRA